MKKVLLILILFLAGLAVAFYYLRQQEFVVVVTEAALQERIEEVFPVEKQYLVLVTLHLSDPRVQLKEGADRIHYGMQARVTIPAVGMNLSGTGEVSGRLRYDRETRGLYLHDSVVEEISIAGVPSNYRRALHEVADLIARQHLDRHAVYTVDRGLVARLPAAVALRDVRVADGQVHAVFGLADRFWE